MRWTGRRRSEHVEDQRGARPRGLAVGGGAGGLIILVLALLLGLDPGGWIGGPPQTQQPASQVSTTVNTEEDQLKEFVSVVLADTEDIWTAQFRESGRTYRKPTLVLFSDYVSTPSGMASAATGPFYSPADEKIYLDLGFFDELSRRFGAPGDFAQAYVIAHEVGHHVQKQLGILESVSARQQRVSKEEANDLSVRLELQADFLAGVWAHYAQEYFQAIEPGDIDEALRAATAIGDDRIQMQTRGYVVPDSFTHGTSEQRARWFRRGFDSGDLSQGNTFSVSPGQL